MLLQMSHNGIGDALCDLGLKNWLIPIYEFHIHSAHEFMVQMLHVRLALTWNCYKHAVSSISCNVLHILLEVKLLVYLRTRRIVSITPWYANYVHKNKLDPLYSINTPQIHSRYAAFLSMAAKAILSSFSEKFLLPQNWSNLRRYKCDLHAENMLFAKLPQVGLGGGMESLRFIQSHIHIENRRT